MVDPVTHRLFRDVKKRRVQPTRVVGGRVESVEGDRVRVRITDQLEPVAVRADGVVAVGEEVQIPLGTDGRPMGPLVPGAVPVDATPVHVGPTGRRILGQQLEIDQTVQELEDARDRLDEMDDAITVASRYLITSESLPPEVSTWPTPDEYPQGAIWQQTTYDLATDQTITLGRWVLDASDEWVSIEEGAGVIHAETVSAAVGVFIDAMMENLTVVGAANISEAAVGELTVRIAAILELAVEQLNVGPDIRFTSSGLVFYSPVADGQDPDDWANRVPLISITPTGDTSIAVAQDGEITAGITPEGHVWGEEINGNSISVGGQNIMEMIDRAPRGVLAVTRLASNLTLSNSWREVIGLNVVIEKDRMYRLSYILGLSASGGTVTYSTDIRWGSTSVNIITQRHTSNTDKYHERLFRGDEYGFVEGEPVKFVTNVHGGTASGTVWTGTSLHIEDVGPAIDIYSQTVTNPTPPVTRYSRSFGSNASWGVRPDGSNAIDPRLTLGGYNIYGSDMAENIVYQVPNLGVLSGSTIIGAKITLTFTANAPVSFRVDLGTGPTQGHVNVYNGTAGTNGQLSFWIPDSLKHHVIGKSAIIIKPFTPGSMSSYGYLGSGAWLDVTYDA